MLRRFVLGIGVLAGMAAPGLGQGVIQPGSIPTRRALERVQLEKHWMGVVPLGVGERLTLFNVSDNQLFAQTSRGNLHTYNAETGAYQWGVKLADINSNTLPVSTNSDMLFVTALKTLHALDRRTGRPIWKAELDNLPSTGTICDEEVVAVGLRSGKLQGFNIRDHSKDTPPGYSAGSFAWAWQTGGILKSRPLVTPHLVTFASTDHKVYTAIKADGDTKSELIYRYLTAGPISASLVGVGNRTLVVGSEDFNVYGIDLFTAETRWVIATGAPIDQEPLVSGDDVIVINERGRLFRISGKTGQVVWERQSKGQKILALSPSRIYLANIHNDLSIIDRATGQVIHSPRDTQETAGLHNRELALVFPNYQNDRLYAGGHEGLLFCAREIGKLQPTPLRDPGTPPFGTIPEDGLKEESTAPPPAAAQNPPAENNAPAEDPDK